jgi:hypothetical protein
LCTNNHTQSLDPRFHFCSHQTLILFVISPDFCKQLATSVGNTSHYAFSHFFIPRSFFILYPLLILYPYSSFTHLWFLTHASFFTHSTSSPISKSLPARPLGFFTPALFLSVQPYFPPTPRRQSCLSSVDMHFAVLSSSQTDTPDFPCKQPCPEAAAGGGRANLCLYRHERGQEQLRPSPEI